MLEITRADKRLSGDHQPAFVLDVGRDATDGTGIVSNDFSHISITSGGSLNQLTALIGQFHGKSIQLEHKHYLVFSHKAAQLHTVFHFIQRQQRDFMRGFLQLAYRRISHSNCRRVCQLYPRLFFQLFQFIKKTIINLVADTGTVLVVILVAVNVKPAGQFPLLHQQILIH